MERNEIDFYLHNILRKQLQKFKILNYGLYSIIDNVREQLESIIKNWNEIDFRNAILLIGSEEGIFYEPHTTDEIGNLVVVAIRNSLFETLVSVDAKEYLPKKYVTNADIKEITSSAIDFFSNVDLKKLSEKIVIEDNYYKNIAKKYPTAFKSLIELGKCDKQNSEREFNSFNYEKEYVFEELLRNTDSATKKNLENGITEKFNDSLIHILKGIKIRKYHFFM